MRQKRVVNMLTKDSAFGGWNAISSTGAVQFGPIVQNPRGFNGVMWLEIQGITSVTGVGFDLDLYGSYNGYQWTKHSDVMTLDTTGAKSTAVTSVPGYIRVGFDAHVGNSTEVNWTRIMLELDEDI